jgi:hypothetical protein
VLAAVFQANFSRISDRADIVHRCFKLSLLAHFRNAKMDFQHIFYAKHYFAL